MTNSSKTLFPFSSQDAVECFLNANNLNAAIKKIVKSDTSKNPKTTRFCKALKTTLKSPKEGALTAFVEKAMRDYQEYLFVVIRNSYAPIIDPLLDGVIEEYADVFNDTYSIDPVSGAITVTAEAAFEEIGGNAIEAIETKVNSAELPPNGFIRSAIIYSLFDGAVLEELRERLGE